MTKEEARDFIAKHYTTYMSRLVSFDEAGVTARIKAIDILEGEGGEFIATCFLENPNGEDPDFKDHIFAHLSLQEVIDTGRILSS